MHPPLLERTVLLWLLSLLPIASTTGCAEVPHSYENRRFGFSVPTPAGATVTESDNGDGARITRRDRPGVELRAWGGHDVWGLADLSALGRIYRSLDAEAYANPRPARLGDLPALEYTTSAGGTFSRTRLALRDGVLYGVCVKAPVARRAEALEAFERLAAGFALP